MRLFEFNYDGEGLPDASGKRGKGLELKPLPRAGDYPYDLPVTYGTPQLYDRGSGGGGGGLHLPITPKDTSHSAWDDANEAMGTPMNFTQSSKTGNTPMSMPGGWARNPPKGWDEDEIEDQLSCYGEGAVAANPTPQASLPTYHDSTDDDVEKKIDRLFNRPDSIDVSLRSDRDDPADIVLVSVEPAPFATGLAGHGDKSGPGGLVSKQSSVWELLSRLLGDS